MPKFAIIGTMEVVPGAKEQLLPLLMAHRARCLRDEPGTLQFEVLQPHDDSTKVMLYEVYQDEAAFEAHWNGAFVLRAREDMKGMILQLTGKKCALLD